MLDTGYWILDRIEGTAIIGIHYGFVELFVKNY